MVTPSKSSPEFQEFCQTVSAVVGKTTDELDDNWLMTLFAGADGNSNRAMNYVMDALDSGELQQHVRSPVRAASKSVLFPNPTSQPTIHPFDQFDMNMRPLDSPQPISSHARPDMRRQKSSSTIDRQRSIYGVIPSFQGNIPPSPTFGQSPAGFMPNAPQQIMPASSSNVQLYHQDSANFGMPIDASMNAAVPYSTHELTPNPMMMNSMGNPVVILQMMQMQIQQMMQMLFTMSQAMSHWRGPPVGYQPGLYDQPMYSNHAGGERYHRERESPRRGRHLFRDANFDEEDEPDWWADSPRFVRRSPFYRRGREH